MTDPAKTADDRGNEVPSQVGGRAAGSRLGRLLLCLMGCLILAAGILLAKNYFPAAVPPRPPVEEAAAPKMEAGSAPASDSASAPVSSSAPRPAILLASSAVPATVDQLQEEAEYVANDLRRRFPDLAEALHVVAMLDSQLRRTGEAEELWRKCIELDADNVSYYVNLAAIAIDRGNSQLAVDTLQQALDAGLSSPDAYHHMAVALTNLGRCEEAETTIQKALAIYPQVASYWLVLGQAQLKLGKAAEAETSLKKAISMGSRSPDAYFALGNACARQGKKEEAAEYRGRFTELKSTRDLDPQRRFQVLSTAEARRTAVTVLCEAATVHFQKGDSLEAERLLHRAIALDPAGRTACRLLAGLYRAASMAAEEQVVRRRLIEIDPLNLINHLDLAKVSAELGDVESAEAAMKLAIAISPATAGPYTSLAQLYLQTGKAAQARWYAQEAVRREPTAEGYVLLGSTCRLLGDQANAEAAFARARELRPDKPPGKQETPETP